jgi:hypothetical protein
MNAPAKVRLTTSQRHRLRQMIAGGGSALMPNRSASANSLVRRGFATKTATDQISADGDQLALFALTASGVAIGGAT